jgi:hypothetical protein
MVPTSPLRTNNASKREGAYVAGNINPAKLIAKVTIGAGAIPGGAIVFIDERNVAFRPRERPAVLKLACIEK